MEQTISVWKVVVKIKNKWIVLTTHTPDKGILERIAEVERKNGREARVVEFTASVK